MHLFVYTYPLIFDKKLVENFFYRSVGSIYTIFFDPYVREYTTRGHQKSSKIKTALQNPPFPRNLKRPYDIKNNTSLKVNTARSWRPYQFQVHIIRVLV